MRNAICFMVGLLLSSCTQSFYFNQTHIDRSEVKRIFKIQLEVDGIDNSELVKDFEAFLKNELSFHNIDVYTRAIHSIGDDKANASLYVLNITTVTQGPELEVKKRLKKDPIAINPSYKVLLNDPNGKKVLETYIYVPNSSEFKEHWLNLSRELVKRLEQEKLIIERRS